MSQIAGSDLTAAGLADGGIPVLTINGGLSTFPFQLANGNSSISFPVPSLQPSGAGPLTMAFDLIPKGNPSDFSGNGVTWMDFCNKDIVANGAQAFGCAHMGVFANGDMAVGPTAFNGATVGTLLLQSNGTSILKVPSTGIIQFAAAASFSANAAVATTMTSVGPTGANTTVQEWLTIKNSGGTTRYIPCY